MIFKHGWQQQHLARCLLTGRCSTATPCSEPCTVDVRAYSSTSSVPRTPFSTLLARHHLCVEVCDDPHSMKPRTVDGAVTLYGSDMVPRTSTRLSFKTEAMDAHEIDLEILTNGFQEAAESAAVKVIIMVTKNRKVHSWVTTGVVSEKHFGAVKDALRKLNEVQNKLGKTFYVACIEKSTNEDVEVVQWSNDRSELSDKLAKTLLYRVAHHAIFEGPGNFTTGGTMEPATDQIRDLDPGEEDDAKAAVGKEKLG